MYNYVAKYTHKQSVIYNYLIIVEHGNAYLLKYREYSRLMRKMQLRGEAIIFVHIDWSLPKMI